MKKLLAGLVIWAVAALASATNVTNPPVNVNGNPGSVQISQCASVAGNCNNPDMTVNINGNTEAVWINGKYTVIKGQNGKDGANGLDGAAGRDGVNGVDGKDGRNGIDGVNGKDGVKGDTGATGRDGTDGKNGVDGAAGTAGANGADGRDGTNGIDGKDADMSIVNHNSQSIASQQKQLSSINQQFKDLRQTVDNNRKKANAGTSTALAVAGIPQVTDNQKFTVGAALGGYESETAIAVGFSARVTDSVIIKASVGTDSQSGVGYSVGTSVGW